MKVLYKNFPESPGVYIMKDARGEILYIGKAVNLRRRVSSYFTRPLDGRMSRMVSRIRRIAHKKTGSALEALVLEAELIKKHQPPFNILEKDDKSFLYVIITKDAFPRVLLLRGKEASEKKIEVRNVFGPFVSARAQRSAPYHQKNISMEHARTGKNGKTAVLRLSARALSGNVHRRRGRKGIREKYPESRVVPFGKNGSRCEKP